jgi:hypothetical protein
VKFSDIERKPVIIFAVEGYNIFSKLDKIIGSSDPFIAKKVEPNSLNALFTI